jgi:hypothetical protein
MIILFVWHTENIKSRQLGKEVQLQSEKRNNMDEHGTFLFILIIV